METIKELIEQRNKLVADMRALITVAEQREGPDKGAMNQEENEKFNLMDDEMEKISAQIERRQKVEAAEKRLQQSSNMQAAPALENRAKNPLTGEARKQAETKAFEQWVRFGFDGLNPEQRGLMATRRASVAATDLPEEVRAQAVGSGAGGGYLVPQGFSEELEKALKAFGGMREVARLFPTPTGNDIPWPTVDDTANVGELLGENIAAAVQDVAFGQIILKAYKYSSKLVLVSMELLQDSFFDIGTILRDLLAERIGRITNTHFTTGDNTGKPQGVVPGSTQGKVGIVGQTTSVIYDDVIDLEHSVDPLYRPGSIYMMADSTLKVMKKIKDTTGRPIWQPAASASLQAGQESFNNINGYRYVINQDMAVMAANAKSILFGNFSKYIIRDVREFTLLRLQERYAEFGQVGFLAFTRSDGRYINTAAIKHYANSAT
jgi:HK97 family phage major capsid protein